MSARARLALVATGVTIALAAAGCGGGDTTSEGSTSGGTAASGGSGEPLTFYNAQHEELTQAIVDGFTQKTGIEVQMRN
ncbi:MAG TPA: hypothetical protein VFJ12_04225, partial [Segeticoccus sp.]|nr:hypothetical protein [Segeticoccus sp.]